MPVGFEFFNQDNKLVLSGLSRGFKWLGYATKTLTVQPTNNSAGYSEFQITANVNYLIAGVFLPEAIFEAVSIRSIIKSGSLWTIRVQRGDGTITSNGFLRESVSYPLMCWGEITQPSSVGIVTYDNTGAIRNDILQMSAYIAAYTTIPQGATSQAYISSSLRAIGASNYPILLTNIQGTAYEEIGSLNQLISKDYNYRAYFKKNTIPPGFTPTTPWPGVIERTPTLNTRFQEYEPGGGFPSIPFEASLPEQTIMFADGYRLVAQ